MQKKIKIIVDEYNQELESGMIHFRKADKLRKLALEKHGVDIANDRDSEIN